MRKGAKQSRAQLPHPVEKRPRWQGSVRGHLLNNIRDESEKRKLRREE